MTVIVAVLIVVGCGFLIGWGVDKQQSKSKPPHESTTLYHIEGFPCLGFTRRSLDEARDVADWLDESGQLTGFWFEEVEA